MLRVRIERPATLQEAINIAKRCQFEVKFVRGLVRRNEIKVKEKSPVGQGEETNSQRPNSQHRFRPYNNNAKSHVKNFAAKSSDETCNGEGSSESRCFNCNKPGHMARNCKVRVEKRECYNCHKTGHIARNCRLKISGKDRNIKTCNYCNIVGHNYEVCRKRLKRVEELKKQKTEDLNEK